MAKSFRNSHFDNGNNISAKNVATYERMDKDGTDLMHDIDWLQRQA